RRWRTAVSHHGGAAAAIGRRLRAGAAARRGHADRGRCAARAAQPDRMDLRAAAGLGGARVKELQLGLGFKRLPLVLQSEAGECGLACLAMIASWHGLKTDLPNLRRRFSLSLKGCSAADLLRLAERLQLNARAVRAELDQF